MEKESLIVRNNPSLIGRSKGCLIFSPNEIFFAILDITSMLDGWILVEYAKSR